MADRRGDAELGAKERGTQFGDQLFPRIGVATSRSGEVAIEASSVTRPVTQFVELRASEVFGAAALGTLINIGVATTEDRPSLSFSGVGAVSNYDPIDDALRDGVQRSASIVTNRVVDRSLAIGPTIRLDAGTRISVIVTRSPRL